MLIDLREIVFCLFVFLNRFLIINRKWVRKRLGLLWPRASKLRIYYRIMFGQLSTTRSNATEVIQYGATCSCSRPQLATDNGIRDGRFMYCTVRMRATNHKTCCNQWAVNARPSECQLGYKSTNVSKKVLTFER